MLFFNIDHIEPALRSLSQSASSQFFIGSSALCQMLAHLENADASKAAPAAAKAAKNLRSSANAFRTLADTINTQHPWVKEAVKEVSFSDAARDVRLSSDSQDIKAVTAQLIRGELDEVLMSCAKALSTFSRQLRQTQGRLSSPNVLLDFEYEQAHLLIGEWRDIIALGQYVSSVCLHSTRVSA